LGCNVRVSVGRKEPLMDGSWTERAENGVMEREKVFLLATCCIGATRVSCVPEGDLEAVETRGETAVEMNAPW